MRALHALLALLVALLGSCADEPAQNATTSEPTWLTDRPENAHPYADDTLARFANLVEGDGWRDATWNAQGTLEVLHEKTGLAFVLVPRGSFRMGFLHDPPWDQIEESHWVAVETYLLSKIECAQRAWDVIGGADGRFWNGPDLPIETVSWTAADSWCRDAGLRLPSASEWEYACRAGTRTPFSTGDWLPADQANYDGRYPYERGPKGGFRKRTVAAGSLPANHWGLHEMHGNVWEWCRDKRSNVTGIDFCVLRGGGWIDRAGRCRSAISMMNVTDYRRDFVGFRPAADLPK